MPHLRLAAAQLNTVVGDLSGNVERILDALAAAEAAGADICVVPELAIPGYPPEDLLLKPGFVADNVAALEKVAAATGQCAVVVGFVGAAPGGEGLANAAAVCAGGRVVGVYRKRFLPNYGVFDEQRWFIPSHEPPALFGVAGAWVGVSICEDVWFDDGPVAHAGPGRRGRRRQPQRLALQPGPAGGAPRDAAGAGGRSRLRHRVRQPGGRAGRAGLRRRLPHRRGRRDPRRHRARSSPPTSWWSTSPSGRTGPTPSPSCSRGSWSASPAAASGRPWRRPRSAPRLGDHAEVYAALVLGTRDYLRKNGFSEAVIGLSGGIDSSLVAAIAVDAIGADRVHGLSMPSRYSSEGSRHDAGVLAERLGIDLKVVPIEEAHVAFASMLAPVLGREPSGLTDENLQSRLRGVLLMAVSNAKGWIVLTTGNKSEMATGYSTLYGDSAGRLRRDQGRAQDAGLRPVPSPQHPGGARGPARADPRQPSSTSRPRPSCGPISATTSRSRPTRSSTRCSRATSRATSRRPSWWRRASTRRWSTSVVRLVDGAEYKRRQMPPGVRITTKAFGKDRRMPITNRYRSSALEESAGG